MSPEEYLRVLQKLSDEEDFDTASLIDESEFVEHLEDEIDSKIKGDFLELPLVSSLSLHHIYPKYDDSTDVGDDVRESGNDDFLIKTIYKKGKI